MFFLYFYLFKEYHRRRETIDRSEVVFNGKSGVVKLEREREEESLNVIIRGFQC